LILPSFTKLLAYCGYFALQFNRNVSEITNLPKAFVFSLWASCDWKDNLAANLPQGAAMG
jgi:hypothetical protein